MGELGGLPTGDTSGDLFAPGDASSTVVDIRAFDVPCNRSADLTEWNCGSVGGSVDPYHHRRR